MRRGFAVAAGLGATLIGCAPGIDYDPRRLTTERMERIVAWPMQAVRSGDLAEGEQRLERLRAQRTADRRRDPYADADLEESFGILLIQEANGDSRLRRAALSYLARAVDEVRKIKGPAHPEVALALQTYGDGLMLADQRANAPAARRAFCGAFAIRRASLGLDHPETGAALAAVAKLRPGSTAFMAFRADGESGETYRPIERLLSLLTGRTPGKVREDRQLAALGKDARFTALCNGDPPRQRPVAAPR